MANKVDEEYEKLREVMDLKLDVELLKKEVHQVKETVMGRNIVIVFLSLAMLNLGSSGATYFSIIFGFLLLVWLFQKLFPKTLKKWLE